MPTIDELAPATAASDTDEVPVSQSGVSRKLTRAQFLAGVQPELALPAGALLGRVSPGTGVPETIAIGSNLTIAGGTLSATAAPYVVASLPAGTVPAGSDLVPLGQAGANTAVSYAQFIAGLSNLPSLTVPGAISTASNLTVTGSDYLVGTNGHGISFIDTAGHRPQIATSGDNIVLWGINSSGARLPVWSYLNNTSSTATPLFCQVPFQVTHLRTGNPTYTLSSSGPSTSQKGLDIGTSYTGSYGTTEPVSNQIYVLSDTANADNVPINNAALKINYQYGGAGTTAGRTGLRIAINPIGTVGGSNPFQVGAEIFATTNYSFGGVDLGAGARGQLVPINTVGRAYSGGTNLVVVSGFGEMNMGIDAGASAAILNGFQISRLNTDAGPVSRFRAMMFAGTQTPTGAVNTIPDMDYGIVWGHDHHQWSFGATSKMIGWIAQGTGTNSGGAPIYPTRLGWGVDLWGVNIVNQAWRSTGFQVDGTGAVTIGTARLGPSPTGLAVNASGQFVSSATVSAGGTGYQIGEYLYGPSGDIYAVAGLSATGVGAVTIVAVGYANTPPSNPVSVSGGSGLGATLNLTWTVGNGITVGGSGQKIGFYGAAPIAKPTVSGARGGNAALTSLIAALSACGLLTDSTAP